MTRTEAIAKASNRAAVTNAELLVICRTDHPTMPGDYHYVIDRESKRLWTPGETVVATFVDGERAS